MDTQGSSFDGTMLEWLGWRIAGVFITVITLGIGFPWAFCMMYQWEVNHTVINGKRLKFNGTGGSLIGHWILWWLLTIITFGIFGLWVPVKIARWKAERTSFYDPAEVLNKCPFCANEIKREDTICQFCNKDLTIFMPTHKVRLFTNAEGMSLREVPDARDEPFTKLPNGTEIEYLEIGDMVELAERKAPWFKIRTKDNICGWCFSGSLEKI